MSSNKAKNFWTRAQEVALICFYSKNQFLWSDNHIHFTNKDLRKSAIEMFLEKFLDYEFLPSEVEQHFEEMKTEFYTNHNKGSENFITGKAHYKKLSFLLEKKQEDNNFFNHRWTYELETQLIQLNSQNPCLWNRNDKEYKNTAKKMSLYIEFAQSLDNRFSAEQIKEKFQRMKTVFYANQRRVNKSLTSENVFSPKYLHYQSMKFLLTDSSDEYISDSILSEGIFENVEIVEKIEIVKKIRIPVPEFTREIEEKIIKFFSFNPCLWDSTTHIMKKTEFQSVLGVLAHQLGNKFSVETIIEKFRRMKDVFQSNHRQLQISTERGEEYKPAYIHYQAMKFLTQPPPPIINSTEKSPIEIIKSIYICRVCLDEDKDLQPIDHRLFEFCTGINLKEKEYSSNICKKCEKLLSDLNEFKNRCISTDTTIEQFYLSTINATEIKEEQLEIFAEPIFTFTLPIKEEEFEFISDESAPEKLVEDDAPSMVIEEPPSEEVALCMVKDEPPSEEVIVIPQLKSKRTKKSNASKFKLCPYCGKMFYSRFIGQHLKSHTKDPNIRFPCDLCDQTFSLKYNADKHRLGAHAKIKRYSCEICDLKFVYFSTKRHHMANFHKAIEKKFVCKICGNKYLINSLLENHMTIHTNERPNQCKECSNTFRSKQQLNRHMLTHTKEKNFKCEFCEKLFSKRSSLMMHERIHTGLRDYVCPVCSKDFIQSHVMRTHCRSNHPEYELPPSGTIMSQRRLKKMEEAKNDNKED